MNFNSKQPKLKIFLVILWSVLLLILVLFFNLPIVGQLFTNRININPQSQYSFESFDDGVVIEIQGTPNSLMTLQSNDLLITSFTEYNYDFMIILDLNYGKPDTFVCMDKTEDYSEYLVSWKDSLNNADLGQTEDAAVDNEPEIPEALLAQFSGEFTAESRLLDCSSASGIYTVKDGLAILAVQFGGVVLFMFIIALVVGLSGDNVTE